MRRTKRAPFALKNISEFSSGVRRKYPCVQVKSSPSCDCPSSPFTPVSLVPLPLPHSTCTCNYFRSFSFLFLFLCLIVRSLSICLPLSRDGLSALETKTPAPACQTRDGEKGAGRRRPRDRGQSCPHQYRCSNLQNRGGVRCRPNPRVTIRELMHTKT